MARDSLQHSAETKPSVVSSRRGRGMRAMAGWRWRALWLGLLFAGLVASRVPLAPRYLITFDEINFALSIQEFNPALHQPQPPGDPLFVGLLKLLSFCIPKVETLFLIAGLLVSMAALVLLWALGEQMLGRNWGILAALLLLFNPPFWLSALTNPVRLCLAAGATAVAFCVFTALRRQSSAWYLIAAAALGIAAGFRPVLAVTLAPLVIWAAMRLRPGWKMHGAATAIFAAALTCWLPALASAVGGWRQFWDLLRAYAYDQTRATSAVTGAPMNAAARMAWDAIVWSCLGALSWVWAVPSIVSRNHRTPFDSFHRRFLMLWFLPGLLFYALFHVADPDHTLAIVPVTCLAGAGVLSAFAGERPLRTRAIVASIAILLNAFLFLKPISKTARASTYKPVRWLDHYIAGVLDGIGSSGENGLLTVVFYQPTTGWRHLSYYSPTTQIVVIRSLENGALATWHIQGRHVENWSGSGSILLPSCGPLAWVDPVAKPSNTAAVPVETARDAPISFTRAPPGTSFEFRGFRLVTGPEPCAAAP